MKEKEIIIKDLKINYKKIGQGQPLLILHGWPSNSDRWLEVSDILSKNNVFESLEKEENKTEVNEKPKKGRKKNSLKDGIQVIVPDLPGFGKSEEPKESWSLDNYVDWLYEFTNNVPELKDNFIILGHSFGGAVAAKFSIKYNQKVKKLFLVSAACIRKNTSFKKVFYNFAKIAKLFSFLPYYNLFKKGFYKFIIRKSDYPYQDGVMKSTYLKVILEDLSYKLMFIKVPTVLIWGDKDNLTPINQAEFIHQKVLESKLVVIPLADHSLHIKMPEVLAGKIIENVS